MTRLAATAAVALTITWWHVVAFSPLPGPKLAGSTSAAAAKRVGKLRDGVPGLYAPPTAPVFDEAALGVDAPTLEVDAPAEAPGADEQEKETFQWLKHWYPLAVAEYLDEGRPHARTLLGRELVLWYDGQQWRAFADMCPHRLVPLSEGRVEKDGTLLCSYHAWRFNGDGSCASMPQFAALPSLTFVFAGDAKVAMAPDAYMEAQGGRDYVPRVYFTEYTGAQLGENFMQGHDVIFDQAGSRVGFAPSACDWTSL